MSTYLHKNEGSSETFNLTERHIYGSSRLGLYKQPVSMLAVGGTGDFQFDIPGYRHYELTNHASAPLSTGLGNVTSTITAQKVPIVLGGNLGGYLPQIIHSYDYSPFGVKRLEFDVTAMSTTHPVGAGDWYGFNGQEKDDEVAGSGNSYTAEFWQYDSRLARRWNLDPVPQIFISDYAAFGNNPILNVDPNGAYFFGLFGSTSEQRNAANGFSKKVGGTVINKQSKDIVVSYTQQIGHQTHPVVLNRNQYFNKDGGLISDEGEINTFKPDFFDNWADSDNSVAQLGYGIADDGYLFLQSNPIGAAFDMDGVRSHLDGTNATQSEVESGFIGGISNFVPASKGTKLFSKLNAAQFSSKFKSVLSHIKPSPQTRGKMNGALNKVVDKINNMNWNKTAVKQAKSKSEKLDDAVSE